MYYNGRIRCAIVKALASAWVVLHAGPAAAEPLPENISITWESVAGCDDRELFIRDFAQQIDPTLLTRKLSVTIRIRQKDGIWVVSVQTPFGQRTLSKDSCQEVLRDAAFALAMAITMDEPEPTTVEQAEDPESVKPVASEAASVPSVQRRPTPPTNATLAVGTKLGGYLGALPHPSPGIGFVAAIVVDQTRLEAAVSLWQGQPTRVAEGQGTVLSLVTVSLRGCNDLLGATVSACAGIELGRFRSEPFGTIPLEPSSPWAALEVGGAVSRPLWRSVVFRSNISMVIPLAWPNFITDDDQDLHQPKIVNLRLVSGLEVQFD